MAQPVPVRRVGIVGYGSLGQYLADAVLQRPDQLELAFVWNRSIDKLKGKVPEAAILANLDEFESRKADLIVEVSHPDITHAYGARFLKAADYMVGSPTVFADSHLESQLRAIAMSADNTHGLYIPAGALWGGNDIQKMADRNTLQSLTITMKKHPLSFQLLGHLVELNNAALNVQGESLLYDGPVRALCPLAPNNVNTMAAAALAGHNLGFDKVRGVLIADPRLEGHIVEIELTGPGAAPSPFSVKTSRYNPAAPGAVTGNATYASFLSSMLRSNGQGKGVHLC
ncbi:aspartate dehydrogenase isoform 1 [Capsaspora owczarzaki ATCC 30864]|uniref:Aspartate dehydrogenase domain-containing protein n=1 Tax=Capsaspora owczarzaki (strain ATCC 30864) TaxID=595528 RepID=A0A0D2WHX7_CAPO3|nr:aspartate dehydrogenase isoform 1 [Capsaspora owczarzaki ATCC 30864]KJE88448.1 aspartate dehydrogenase isoform 1 [Capsaspora owczarzaki ATCC 30864]|eukprot:XP_004364976.1 aspartate dehydrogenase isoform 1 [Capsaspora owczarzaki ATCC 30864]